MSEVPGSTFTGSYLVSPGGGYAARLVSIREWGGIGEVHADSSTSIFNLRMIYTTFDLEVLILPKSQNKKFEPYLECQQSGA
jgi:hypothetical protein